MLEYKDKSRFWKQRYDESNLAARSAIRSLAFLSSFLEKSGILICTSGLTQQLLNLVRSGSLEDDQYSELASVFETNPENANKDNKYVGAVEQDASGESRIEELLFCNQDLAKKLAESEENLWQSERKVRRMAIELSRAKKINAPAASQEQGRSVEASSFNENVLKRQVEALELLAAERLQELEKTEASRAHAKIELARLEEKIRRIPESQFKNQRTYDQLVSELNRLKYEVSSRRSSLEKLSKDIQDSNVRRDKLANELEDKIVKKRLDLFALIENLEAEIIRMRKERDQMRIMYEQVNFQASSLKSRNDELQKLLDGEKEKSDLSGKNAERLSGLCKLIEEQISMGASDNTLQQIMDEKTLLAELESLGEAFETISTQNKQLIKQLQERDEELSKIISEKLKAEFSLTQCQKEAEIVKQKASKTFSDGLRLMEDVERLESQQRSASSALEKHLNESLANLEEKKLKLAQVSAELNEAKNRLDYLASKYDENIMAEKLFRIEKLEFEKTRISEECTYLKRKIESYGSSDIGLVKDLKDEVENYKV